jgi:outer membrane protein, multidrug efflux system
MPLCAHQMHPAPCQTRPTDACAHAPCRGLRALGWLGVLALGLLAGCNLGPRYHRPDIPPPAAWKSPDSGGAQWPSADWWRGFGSPELDGLIAEAVRANDDLAAAVARVREADAQVRIAGAPLLPFLDADVGGSRQSVTVPMPVIYNSFSAQLSASYQLDFWGKNLAARAAAVALANASRFDRETVELSVLSSVANTYFTVLEVQDRLRIAHDNLASAESILKGLKLDESVGTDTGLDVAQQETVVATLSAAIPPLEQQLRQTLDALAILLGREPEALALNKASLDGMVEPAVLAGLPSELLHRRPDVASAEAQLISANADIRQARAAFFPSIQLTASGGYESTTLSTLTRNGSRVFDIGGGITQPIFQGGALLGQYQYSKARYAELLADYHKTVISAFGNVEDSLIAVRASADQLARQQNAVDKARRAYEFAQAQFHAGIINILTVLNTETALFTAQDALAQVKLTHLQALVNLFNALGGGWQYE